MKSTNLDNVQFWKWLDPKTIAIVTDVSVYHWTMDGNAEPVKMFDRAPSAGQPVQVGKYPFCFGFGVFCRFPSCVGFCVGRPICDDLRRFHIAQLVIARDFVPGLLSVFRWFGIIW